MDRFLSKKPLFDVYLDFWKCIVRYLSWPELYALQVVCSKSRTVSLPFLLSYEPYLRSVCNGYFFRCCCTSSHTCDKRCLTLVPKAANVLFRFWTGDCVSRQPTWGTRPFGDVLAIIRGFRGTCSEYKWCEVVANELGKDFVRYARIRGLVKIAMMKEWK